MVLPKEPFQIRDTKLQYYAYRWPRLFTGLNLLLCPFTCGCFYCWTMPRDHLASDMMYEGPPLNERMSDMHFARQGRKFLRRDSLSDEKPAGKVDKVLKRQRKSSDQPQSPLFAKLPYEIRLQIFEQVLADTGALFVHTVPTTNDWDSFYRLQIEACEPAVGTELKLCGANNDSLQTCHLTTALLRTCRLIYREALPLLYTRSQFVFENPRHLIAFTHTIPRAHLQRIRSIRLDFSQISSIYVHESHRIVRTFVTPLFEPMQESLRIIGQMRDLRFLQLVFRVPTDAEWESPEVKTMFEDLREYYGKVRGATYDQCKVHLLVQVEKEMVHESMETGMIEATKE